MAPLMCFHSRYSYACILVPVRDTRVCVCVCVFRGSMTPRTSLS